jgi:plastocyanin
MKLPHILTVLMAALAVVLSIAGCGGGEAATPRTATTPAAASTSEPAGLQQVTLTARDNAFEPKTVQVEAGKPIRLTVVNGGENVHEVEVKDLMPETKLAPGQSKVVDIPAQPAGTHKIYCEIHEDEGMEGEFVAR